MRGQQHLQLIPLSLATAILALSACATVTRAPSRPERQGRATYQRVQPSSSVKRYSLSMGQKATGAVLTRNPAPVYPPALVVKELPPVKILARLSVNTYGNVSAVHISHYQGPKTERTAFDNAVRHTAMTWKFIPLTVLTPVKGQSDTFTPTQKAFSVNFRFHFKVVNGHPVTSSGRDKTDSVN